MKVARLSAICTGRLHTPPPPRKYLWYSFLSEAGSNSGPKCSRKDYINEKFQWHHRESNPRLSDLQCSASTNCTTAKELQKHLGFTLLPKRHWIKTSRKCFVTFLDLNTDGSRCSTPLTTVSSDKECAKSGQRSQEANLICNAAYKIISETRNLNIRNSTNDCIARFHSKLLLRIILYYWQYNTLFLTKCKGELHLKKLIIALLDFVDF
jgi:hypothetical protein